MDGILPDVEQPRQVRLSRRGFVLLAGAAGVTGLSAGLAGCTGGTRSPSGPSGGGVGVGASPTPSTPSADEVAARRMAGAALALLGQVDAVRAARPASALALLLDRVAADHRAHLVLVGAAGPSATTTASASGSPPASASAAVTTAASGPASASPTARPVTALVQDLARAESQAGAVALADVAAVTPAMAALLTRVAAARAVHADLLLRAQKATVDVPAPARPDDVLGSEPSARTAVEALLAGEHAAVYAFGWVTARASGADQARGRASWSLHRAQRDALERLLVTASATPPAAEPAYDLGSTDPATVAATVEKGLAAVAVSGAAQTTGASRTAFAQVAVLAARRAAQWSAQPFTLGS